MGSTIRSRRFGVDHAEAKLRQEMRDEADADAQERWDTDEFHEEWHADLLEVIWLGFQHENLVELFSDVDYAGEFEPIILEEVTGLEAFWVAEGGQIDASNLDSRTWNLPPDQVGYHVYENENKIRSGFSRYQDKLIPSAIMQMDAAINSRLLRTYQAAIPGPSSPSYITSNGFSLSLIDDALAEVDDAASARPDADPTITIVGRGLEIAEFFNVLQSNDNFAPSVQEDIIRLGVLGTYRGAKIVKLRNWHDRNGRAYFPANELMITSTSAALTGFWDGEVSKEWVEEGGEYWHHWSRRKTNCVVHHPEFARRYVDTSKAA